MPIFEQFDIVVVPFPFTERESEKRRPAIVLSRKRQFQEKTQKCVLAMITTSRREKWPGDTTIADLKKAGLESDSFVRFKLFTLDCDLIVRKIGTLGAKDTSELKRNFKKILL